jgi:hypothetical protein
MFRYGQELLMPDHIGGWHFIKVKAMLSPEDMEFEIMAMMLMNSSAVMLQAQNRLERRCVDLKRWLWMRISEYV